MRQYWSQAAMLLLGVSLTVGFYEGRRLVKNTAKALTAATSITASASRRGRDRDREAEEEEVDVDPGIVAADDEDETLDRRARRRLRSLSSGTSALDDADPSRTDKLLQLRQRQRQRFSPGRNNVLPSFDLPNAAIPKAIPIVAPVDDTAAEVDDQ